MKIRSIRYILKQSCVNAYRNRLMSLASISIISAALILFGVFYLILVNLNHNLDMLSQQSKIQVYCLPELTDEQVDAVKTEISNNKYIESFTVISKKEQFEQFKKYLTANKEQGQVDILEGYSEDDFNVSFNVKVKDSKDSKLVADELLSLAGVQNVEYSQDTIDFIANIAKWVKVVSVVLIGLLLIISIFIISNTIKLTVFARRKEINIMKYIGATDWFIRWPFIYEGVLIGIIGAVIAFVLVSYIYSIVGPMLNNELVAFSSEFAAVKFQSIWGTLALIYIGVSVVIGVSGSVMSIRKHLHV